MDLESLLGPTLVTRMSDGGDGWEDLVESVWKYISEREGDDVARAWFIGSNEKVDEDTPVEAVRAGLFGQVWHSAVTDFEE